MTTKTCTNCGKEVSISTSVGQHCPHCGAEFVGERIKQDPSVAALQSAPPFSQWPVKRALAVTIIGIITGAGLVIAGIALLLSVGSTPADYQTSNMIAAIIVLVLGLLLGVHGINQTRNVLKRLKRDKSPLS